VWVLALRDVQAGEILIMTPASLALCAIFLILLLLLVKPLGAYIANVMEGRPIWPLPVGARFETFIYRVCGIDPGARWGGSGTRLRCCS
jgi:K+-transporting ATPase ATPase A chain